MIRFDFSNLRGDLFGGITAGVVALPLSLALGVASGLGPIAGLYGAIILGFFGSLFNSTGPAVNGPTGPMVVVIAGIVAVFPDNLELVFTAIILAGVLQITFGVIGVGRYIRLVPYPVISGFMSGIGAIIIILQIGRFFGGEPPGDPVAALLYVPEALAGINYAALALTVITLVVVFAWPAKFGKVIPAPLAGLIIGTLLGWLVFPLAPVLGDIPTGLPSLHLPVFESSAMLLVIKAAFVLAVLGTIDSLLTSIIVDNLTRTRHSSRQELIGQGIGNTLAGLFGATAGASATMRTFVNMRSGGKTRLAGMTHAVFLLAVILGLGPLASMIPHAVLAGILVKVGWDIVDWNYLRNADRGPRSDLALMATVFALTVFTDLIVAVGTGVMLAAIIYVQKVSHAQIAAIKEMSSTPHSDEEAELLERSGKRIAVFDLAGALGFEAAANFSHHIREMSHQRNIEVLILDFTRVPFLDVSAAKAIEAVAIDTHLAGKELYLAGVREDVQRILTGLNADHGISDNDRFATRIIAIRAAMTFLESGSNPPGNRDAGAGEEVQPSSEGQGL